MRLTRGRQTRHRREETNYYKCDTVNERERKEGKKRVNVCGGD